MAEQEEQQHQPPRQRQALSWLSVRGGRIVDASGNVIALRGAAWRGMERLPLVPAGLADWPHRTVTADGVQRSRVGVIDQLRRLGFNLVRLSICQDVAWPGAALRDRAPPMPDTAPEQRLPPPLDILDRIVAHCAAVGMRVLLSMHGGLAPAEGPGPAAPVGRWYSTPVPGGVGGVTGRAGEARSERQWVAAWVTLAARYQDQPAVCGFDLLDQPHASTWDDDSLTGWPAAAERCGAAIQAVNPNALILVQGIGGSLEEPGGQGAASLTAERGADLTGAAMRPVRLPVAGKLAYGAHATPRNGGGQDQPWPRAAEPQALLSRWRLLWGYLAEDGVAPVLVVGEAAPQLGSSGWQDDPDSQWARAMVAYAQENGICTVWDPVQTPRDRTVGAAAGSVALPLAEMEDGTLARLTPLLEPYRAYPSRGPGSGGLRIAALPPMPLRTEGSQILDADGRAVRLRGVNWFGAEGTNFAPHGLWAREYRALLDQVRAWGFNLVRLPWSGDLLRPGLMPRGIDPSINPELAGLPALEVLDRIVAYCGEIGLVVLFDHHRRQAGSGADGSPIGPGYDLARWMADWQALALRYRHAPSVVGADLHNEPHLLSWEEWAALCEACGDALHRVARHWLVFVEGVGTHPTGGATWWGGQLRGAGERPVALRQSGRVVYSPHEYAHSVGMKPWLQASRNAAAVPGWPGSLRRVWRENWGYLAEEYIAPVFVGEVGGRFGLDGSGEETEPEARAEREWMGELRRYLNGEGRDGLCALAPGAVGMGFAYWSLNPNSADTGGLLQDDWTTPQRPKLDLIAPLLGAPGVLPSGVRG